MIFEADERPTLCVFSLRAIQSIPTAPITRLLIHLTGKSISSQWIRIRKATKLKTRQKMADDLNFFCEIRTRQNAPRRCFNGPPRGAIEVPFCVISLEVMLFERQASKPPWRGHILCHVGGCHADIILRKVGTMDSFLVMS